MNVTLQDESGHRRASSPSAALRTIAVSATFTAEPLEKSLAFWLHELDLSSSVVFAPLYQVFQQLLDPASLLATNQSGVNILLIRPEDWLRYLSAEFAWSHIETTIERTRVDFVDATRQFVERSRVPLVIALCPASLRTQAEQPRAKLLERIEAAVVADLSQHPGMHLIASADLLSQYPVAQHDDPYGDELGQIPYTEDFFTALGTRLARTINALYAQPYKVLAVDCDNTLWSGVCAEDGAQGIRIDAGHRALQEFLVAQHDAGMLICLCSKNHAADVSTVFDTRPDLRLRREHISLWQVNWDAKSQNLRTIAQTLGVGLDSIILLDDNPIECAEVRAACPEVLAIQIPAEPQIATFVRHLWTTDRMGVTEDDRQRALRYHEQALREQFRQETTSLQSFLEGLELQVTLQPLVHDQLDRVAQLTQRTNQFNLTTIRRTAAELAHLLTDQQIEHQVVHVRDRFGDYGLVGVLLYAEEADALRIDTLLLSCRTLGRGVEHQMLAWLGRAASERGLQRVLLPFRRTAKNQPAWTFLEQLDGASCEQHDGAIRYSIAADRAATLRYIAERHTAELSDHNHAPRTSAAPTAQAHSLRFQRIAGELYEVTQINAAIRRAQSAQPLDNTIALAVGSSSPVPGITRQRAQMYVAPRSETEQIIAEMWSELLGLERISLNEQFFDIGGHSLRLVQFMVRVREMFGVELPMDVLISGSFTVVDAAHLIERCRIEQADEHDLADLLAELDGLSDDQIAALLADQA